MAFSPWDCPCSEHVTGFVTKNCHHAFCLACFAPSAWFLWSALIEMASKIIYSPYQLIMIDGRSIKAPFNNSITKWRLFNANKIIHIQTYIYSFLHSSTLVMTHSRRPTHIYIGHRNGSTYITCENTCHIAHTHTHIASVFIQYYSVLIL